MCLYALAHLKCVTKPSEQLPDFKVAHYRDQRSGTGPASANVGLDGDVRWPEVGLESAVWGPKVGAEGCEKLDSQPMMRPRVENRLSKGFGTKNKGCIELPEQGSK